MQEMNHVDEHGDTPRINGDVREPPCETRMEVRLSRLANSRVVRSNALATERTRIGKVNEPLHGCRKRPNDFLVRDGLKMDPCLECPCRGLRQIASPEWTLHAITP